MSRFKYLNGAYVNVDTISAMEFPFRNNDKCRVDFKDGAHVYAQEHQIDSIISDVTIKQIIPCTQPIVAIYDCDGELYEEEVFYLGLCENGEIRPIVLVDRYYGTIDSDNFKGLYCKVDTWRPVEQSRVKEICDALGLRSNKKDSILENGEERRK